MDDFNVSSLHESKNEWGARLLTIITPHIVEGLHSIFDEAFKLCKDNNELDKYLMTFQNFITRIPKWNASIIENERKRIVEKSGCGYLEDLVTCVHIIQLKILTAMRAGTKQKKIDINIPKLDDFIHKAYIHAARKIYKNVYLFESNIPPLQIQKNHRELEVIIQECILNAIRESIPVETILRAYMEESVEENVTEEIKEQIIPIETKIQQELPVQMNHLSNGCNGSNFTNNDTTPNIATTNTNITDEIISNKLSFNDVDLAIGTDNHEEQIVAPKTFDRLEQVSLMRNEQRRLESDDDDDINSNVKLNIFDEPIELSNLDVHNIEQPSLQLMPDLLIDDIEILT